MKITEEKFNEFIQCLNEVESFRPLVQKVLDIIESYGLEVARLFDGLTDYSVKRITKTFNMYRDNGFSREEAILLVLNSKVALLEALNNYNKAKKS
jgi:hypothetical protein